MCDERCVISNLYLGPDQYNFKLYECTHEVINILIFSLQISPLYFVSFVTIVTSLAIYNSRAPLQRGEAPSSDDESVNTGSYMTGRSTSSSSQSDTTQHHQKGTSFTKGTRNFQPQNYVA